jgi:hypothetical protein
VASTFFCTKWERDPVARGGGIISAATRDIWQAEKLMSFHLSRPINLPNANWCIVFAPGTRLLVMIWACLLAREHESPFKFLCVTKLQSMQLSRARQKSRLAGAEPDFQEPAFSSCKAVRGDRELFQWLLERVYCLYLFYYCYLFCEQPHSQDPESCSSRSGEVLARRSLLVRGGSR